jgi:hypothetical protein
MKRSRRRGANKNATLKVLQVALSVNPRPGARLIRYGCDRYFNKSEKQETANISCNGAQITAMNGMAQDDRQFQRSGGDVSSGCIERITKSSAENDGETVSRQIVAKPPK